MTRACSASRRSLSGRCHGPERAGRAIVMTGHGLEGVREAPVHALFLPNSKRDGDLVRFGLGSRRKPGAVRIYTPREQRALREDMRATCRSG